MGVHSTQHRGDFHIHNRDSESGMHNFMSVQNLKTVDDPNEGLHTLRPGASLEAIHDSAERLPTFVFNARVYTYLTPLCVVNTITQLVCVAGVHRLTTRVSSLVRGTCLN